jgi:hypothetical protein
MDIELYIQKAQYTKQNCCLTSPKELATILDKYLHNIVVSYGKIGNANMLL